MIYGVDYETRTLSGRKLETEQPEELRCGSCSREAESLSRCDWDDRLQVGPCCETYSEDRCPACDSENLAYGETTLSGLRLRYDGSRLRS